MRRMFAVCSAAALLLGVCCGCRSVSAEKTESAAVQRAPDPAPNLPRLSGSKAELQQGRALGEGVLAAIRSGEIKNLEAAVPAHLLKRPGQAGAYLKKFQTGAAPLGEIRKTEYLGCMDQTVVHDHLWKVTFEKPIVRKDNGENEIFRRTLLFQVSIVPAGDGLTIGNFRFL